MKILMTADAIGGVWGYSLELAQALADDDVEIVLATMGALPNSAQCAEAARVPDLRLVASEYRLEWMEDPWSDVARAGEWLLELEARERPDIVHLNGYTHGALDWKAPSIVVAHSCSCSWWHAVKGERAPSSWDRYRSAVREGLDGASLVVAPTKAMLRALEDEHGAVRDAVVIYNARRAEQFPPLSKQPLILCVGRLWDEGKNAAAVERAARSVTWPTLIAGEGTMPGRAQGVTPNAMRLGHLSTRELAAWMGRASICALPARYEPFGLSALEAALSGCALVLGDIPSARELWGDAAVFVDADDDGALRSALQMLIDDRALLAEAAQACRRRALQFTPARMAAAYMQTYRRVLADPSHTQRRVLACAS